MPVAAFARRAGRRAVALLVLTAFVLGLSLPASAGTTGVLSGTITAAGNKPVAQAKISAAAPSGTYNATTDAKGFFSITGVQVDTYTVSITAAGYDAYALNGVTVNADQTTPIAVTLTTALRTIGRTAARSTSSAFQPAVTTDTYNLGTAQIQTQLGKKGNVSESNLLSTLPGAAFDSSGYPVLRGGRENEEGFQFEGIDYTDAFTNQFVNSLSLNNPGGFQLTPGAGDASSGNSGTGVINLLLKRGTYPAFGSVQLDVLARPYLHALSSEYGFATPNGRFSNYATFTGENQFNQPGEFGTPALQIGAFNERTYSTRRDIADVMTFKFGRDNNQKLEFVYQNQQIEFRNNYAGLPPFFKSNDPFELGQYAAGLATGVKGGLPTAQIQSLLTLYPLQSSPTQPLNLFSGDQQPNETYKLQYSISPSSSLFLTAKYYQVNSVVTFESPFTGVDNFGSASFSLQGGKRTGFQFDGTAQVNDKNLLKFGAKFEYLQPVFDFQSGGDGLFSTGAFSFASNPENAAFLPLSFCAPAGTTSATLATGQTLNTNCGYLAKNGFFNQQIPEFNVLDTVTRHDTALYVDDQFTPAAKWKVDAGLRFEGAKFTMPSQTTNPELFLPGVVPTSQQTNPTVAEPRLAVSYQFGRNDAVRAAFARSIEFAPLAFVDNQVNFGYYQSLPYANLPATAAVCGALNNLPCKNFGQQLAFENQGFNGIPVQPIKPETFTNYEMSYSHQFPSNIALRVTPYFRRSYDALSNFATVKTDAAGNPVINATTGAFVFNPAVSSNLGIEKTTGVELYVTKDNTGPGLSGSFSANYINEFSNVIPLTASEDFFPSIPAQSLFLGNVYRVGFLSPFNMTAAVSYRTRGGFRVNPIVGYNMGYPINPGLITSTFVGSTPFNVPNTNVTSSFGSTTTSQYVSPQNPGSLFKPNIAATRGTPESAAPGGILSAQRLTASASFEWSPPSANSKGPTYGIFVSNIFNQLYNQPSINTRWQPVATGIGGPQTGQTALAQTEAIAGQANFGLIRFGNQPYIMTPNSPTRNIGSGPRTFRFYYQLAF